MMRRALCANWATSLAGIAAAIGTVLAAETPPTPAWVILLGKVLVAGGLAAMGMTARQWNVTSEQSGAGGRRAASVGAAGPEGRVDR